MSVSVGRLMLSFDLRRRAGTFPKYWSRCFGSEHAGYFLRKDLLDHFRVGRATFHNEYVRFHGILSEPVGVVRGVRDGHIDYAWFNLERIYDNILDLGMRPIVEYSFMPAALASGSESIFYWEGNVTMPKRIGDWAELIEAVTRRVYRRYGKAEVRRWYFEVWNEPNLPKWFFKGSMRDYFALYDHAAEAVKRVDPLLRVGGPATACAEWVRETIEHCRHENVARPGRGHTPLDFVSYHLYPSDPFFMESEGMPLGWKGEAFFRESIRRNHEIVRSYRDMDLEIHMTEWNCSSNSRDPIHDAPGGAAFAVKAIQEVAGRVDTFSWWTLSDLFEKGGLPPAPFHGGFGLMTVDGLRKPTWFAFEALQDLGEDLLAKPVSTADHAAGSIPTRGYDGSARLLFWAFHFPKSPKPPVRRVKVALAGFPSGKTRASVTHYRIDGTHSNIRPAWERLGSPDSLSPAQVDALAAQNTFQTLEIKDIPVRHGRATVAFDLPPDAVSYLVVR